MRWDVISSKRYCHNYMCKISVIVPVFNAKAFLEQCVNSVLAQRFKDFELLLIDDGSTDGSALVCDSFAESDDRVRVFHKKNGGVSSARNYGLKEARGEFIAFIDADDSITDSYLEHLISVDSDLTVVGFEKAGKNVFPQEFSSFFLNELPTHWVHSPKIYFYYHFPFCKLFRSRIIHDYSLCFNEKLIFSEDLCFNLEYYSLIDTFSELPYADYIYRIDQVDRERKYQLSAKKLSYHYLFHKKCFEKLQARIGDRGLSTIRDDVYLRLLRKFISFLMDIRHFKDFKREINHFKNEEWASDLVSLLPGKRYPRIMKGAMKHPLFTFLIDIRLRTLLNLS